MAGETRPSFSRPVAGPRPLREPAGSRKGAEGTASGCRKPLIALVIGKTGRDGSFFQIRNERVENKERENLSENLPSLPPRAFGPYRERSVRPWRAACHAREIRPT